MTINQTTFGGKWNWLLSWVPAFLLVLTLYPELFFHPNEFLMDAGNDGQRAYYVFMMYVHHNQNVFQFEYLNYPFGEHVFYLDANPLLLLTGRLLFMVLPFLSPYTIACFNLLHLSMLIIAYFFLYQLFREWRISIGYSVIFSLLIVFLSPQWGKMAGNFSLAALWMIPSILWAFVKFIHTSKKGYGILSVFVATLAFFTHPYLGLIVSIFSGLTWCIYAFFTHSNRIKSIAIGLASIIIPAGIFLITLYLTDTHTNRNQSPGGYGEHYLAIYEWLIQPTGLTGNWLTHIIHKEQPDYFDPAFIPFFFIACMTLGAFKVLRLKDSIISIKKNFYPLLISSGILLLLATGLFGLSKMAFLYDWITPARQFRFLGRFAWPFYNVFAIISCYLFYVWIKDAIQLGQKIPYALSQIILIYGFVDAGLANRDLAKKLTSTDNFYATYGNNDTYWKEMASVYHHNQKSQAILSLPLSLEGSFRFSSPFSYESMMASYQLSWHTQLPIMGGILIRPSETETEIMRTAVNLPFYENPIIHHLPNQQSILLLAHTKQVSIVEQSVINRSVPIHQSGEFSLYQLAISDWTTHSACDTMIRYSGWEIIDNGNVFYSGFEYHASPIAHQGQGAFKTRRGDANLLYTIEPGTQETGTFVASCWIYNQMENAVNGCFIIQEYDNQNVFKGWVTFSNPARSEVVNQNWSYTECVFELNPSHRYEIVLTAYDFMNLNFLVDDLWVRKAGSIMIQRHSNANKFSYNTHIIPCMP